MMQPTMAGGTAQDMGQRSPVTVRRIDNPSTLTTRDDMRRYRLVDLISRGYTLEGDDEYIVRQVQTEYARASLAFLALTSDGRALGSLAYSEIKRCGPAGDIFFAALQQESSALYEMLASSEGRVLYTRGLVTLPEARNRRIAARLLQAVMELKPAIIMGETKDPFAVAARATGFDNHESFYGMSNITPGSESEHTSAHVPVLRAFLALLPSINDRLVEFDPSRVRMDTFFVDTDYLVPSIPVVSLRTKPVIERAFGSLAMAQEHVGGTKTAVRPLISIRKDILRSNILAAK